MGESFEDGNKNQTANAYEKHHLALFFREIVNLFFGSGNFIDNGDGTYTANGSGGIPYKIKHEETPKYPRTARDLGFNRVVSVRIRFLVGLDGRVETAEVLTKKTPDLGFREAALEAVRKMEFEPIVYRGRNIKMYFVKRIVFQP